MSVTGVTGAGVGAPLPDPMDDVAVAPPRSEGVAALDSVRGQVGEGFLRGLLRANYGGSSDGPAPLWMALGIGAGRREPRLPAETIDALPAFRIRAADGDRADVEIGVVRVGGDHNLPGVRMRWRERGEREVSFTWSPGLDGPQFGIGDAAEPIGVRHALVARDAFAELDRHLAAASRPGAPLGEGATADEVAAALEIAARVDRSIKQAETLLKGAPEARLAADVFATLHRGDLEGDRSALERVLADLRGAERSVANRTSLCPDDRRAIATELAAVAALVEEALTAP